mmetsp:Transcript_1147/g.3065  ORF Transcript_1147/g.3065 Transcript_1147/m.3065 type:complete len:329 (+) Transcript_1147:325-1311(+)
MRVPLFTWMSWTTLPRGPFTQPTYCTSIRNSVFMPGKLPTGASCDWSMTFITSATTRPCATFFCCFWPRIRATLYPMSLVVWSMSTCAPLRLSISRIMAPCRPFSQPTQELGMCTESHSPVSEGSSGTVPGIGALTTCVAWLAPASSVSASASSEVLAVPPLPAAPAAARSVVSSVSASLAVLLGASGAARSVLTSDPSPRPRLGTPGRDLSRSMTLASSFWMICFAANTASSGPYTMARLYPSSWVLWSTVMCAPVRDSMSLICAPPEPFIQPTYCCGICTSLKPVGLPVGGCWECSMTTRSRSCTRTTSASTKALHWRTASGVPMI